MLKKPPRKTSNTNKKPSSKHNDSTIKSDGIWTIVAGTLTRPRGNPGKTEPLFKAVGEKIPYKFLVPVRDEIDKQKIGRDGVYIAHDSMGYPRYIGRGDVFTRLDARKKAQPLELVYFSFFIIKNKKYEREIETIMIRAASPSLYFNDRKVRRDISHADVRDFEPGTKYIERQYKKGRRANA